MPWGIFPSSDSPLVLRGECSRHLTAYWFCARNIPVRAVGRREAGFRVASPWPARPTVPSRTRRAPPGTAASRTWSTTPAPTTATSSPAAWPPLPGRCAEEMYLAGGRVLGF
eukprot:1191597-Prorocentrum_minimum.AAC.2